MASSYYDPSSQTEALRAELRGDMVPDPDAARNAARAAAREQVARAPQWAQMRGLAQEVILEGRALRAEMKTRYAELKPEIYPGWLTQRREQYAAKLRELHGQATRTLSMAADLFPQPAGAMPATAAGAINLQVRLQLLDSATPAVAAELVRAAVRRGDAPFMDAAGVLLRSWPEHRNSWASPNATGLASDLLAEIEVASASPATEAGGIAAEQVEAHGRVWRQLLNIALNEDGEIDSALFTTGALQPLLEAPPE